MSKHMTRKGFALASALALAGATLVSSPAAFAAEGDVALAPTTGATWGVFSTDQFSFDSTVNNLLPANVEDGKITYKITNSEQVGLTFDLGAGGADNDTVTLTGYTALGAAVAIGNVTIVDELDTAGQLTDGGDKNGAFTVDFDHHDIVSLVISGIPAALTDKDNTVTVRASDTSAAGDGTVGLTNTQSGALATLGYGNTTYGSVDITVQAYLETDGDATTVENASEVETISFVDPASVSIISAVERFRANGINAAGNGLADALELNDGGDTYLTGTMRFTNTAINYNQVTWSNWKVAVDSSTDADDKATAAIDLRTQADGIWAVADHNFEVVTPAGYLSSNLNAAGKVYFRTSVTGDDLTEGATYKVSFRHASDTAPFNDFDSTAAQVLATAVAATNVEAAISTPADVDQDDAQDNTIVVRPGSKVLTYTAQIRDAADADLATANVPVLAVVTAATYYPTGEVITVSGTANRITAKNQTVISTALTNADGQATFTVNSTTAEKGQVINVEFFVLQAADTFTSAKANGGAATTYAATYTAPSSASITADNTVVASAKPSITFTVVDNYGEASTSNTLGAYNVELKAPDADNLELHAPVAADGTVTFTFDNYLTAGQADVLTAKVYTGTSTNPTYTTLSTSVSLYAVSAVAGINVDAKIADVVVDYVDYINGKTSVAKPGPTGGTTYSGTVVDANGAGVPGAEVTISGDNMQFKNGTVFSTDSVTLNASAAGTFSVTFWTHTASAAGENITVTSGGKTATTLVTSKVEDGDGALSAANLRFSWTIPANPVMNTTYAVVATVTDVWGNPIKGAEVKFSGFAAAEFNAAASATKTTGAAGTATAYLRSIKDVDGLAAINAQLTKVNQDGDANEDVDDLTTTFTTNVATTSWDETAWNDEVEAEINFLKSAADAVSSDQKVNAGSFKGYVALYAKGYAGQRMSAKVGKDWVVVPALASNFERVVEFTGAGVDVAVRIYIDRVLMDTINLTTK